MVNSDSLMFANNKNIVTPLQDVSIDNHREYEGGSITADFSDMTFKHFIGFYGY